MNTITLSATFDGERLRLEADFALPKGARLLVTVLPTEGDDVALREAWRQAGAGGTRDGCGADEPEYDVTTVRERNAGYESR